MIGLFGPFSQTRRPHTHQQLGYAISQVEKDLVNGPACVNGGAVILGRDGVHLANQQRTVCLSCHDAELVRPLASRLVRVVDGQLREFPGSKLPGESPRWAA